MKKKKIIVLVVFAFLIMTGRVQAEITVTEVLQKLDEMFDIGSDFSAKVKLVQQKIVQGVKQLEFFYYNKTVFTFLSCLMHLKRRSAWKLWKHFHCFR